MDTNEGQYMTENSGLCFDITGNCFIAPWFTMWHTYTFAFSVVIPWNVIDRLEVGWSPVAQLDTGRAIHGPLENISFPSSEHIFVKSITLEEQFKLRYGRSASRPTSISVVPITETSKADVPIKETKEIDNTKLPLSKRLYWSVPNVQRCTRAIKWTKLYCRCRYPVR